MESILKKIYYSNIRQDEINYTNSPEYQNFSNKIIEVMELLKKKVGDEDYKTIVKLIELHTESGAFESADAFACGVKYGALIILEILKEKL